MSNFAVFILSHGRAKNIKTIKALRSHGYTGRIIIVIDNMDEQQDLYKKKYDEVYVFDKESIKKVSDLGNNFNDYRSTTYPRNSFWEISRAMGIDRFVQLDDDYSGFYYMFSPKYMYEPRKIKSLDRVFEKMCGFQDKTKALTVAMSQRGEFIGGSESQFGEKIFLHRKAMNSYVCRSDNPFYFLGQMNEDVNMYLVYGKTGHKIFTVNLVALVQEQTQRNKGGMSEIYNDNGTYTKSFYSVMYSPSCVKVSPMITRHKRIHHKINWNHAVPKIVRENLSYLS